MKPFTSSLNDEQIAKLRRVINVARRMAVRLFLNQCNNGVKADTGMEAVRRIIRVLGKLKELVEIDWSDLITIAEQYADTAEMADAAYQKWRSIIMSINPRTVPLTVKVLPTNFFKPAPWRTELRDYQRRTAVDHHGASTADIAKLRNHIKTLRKTGSLSDAAKVGKDHIRWLIPHTLKTCLHNSKALSQYADLVSATQAVQSFEKRLSGMSMMMMRKYEELLKHGPTRTATAQFMKQVSKRTTDDAV